MLTGVGGGDGLRLWEVVQEASHGTPRWIALASYCVCLFP